MPDIDLGRRRILVVEDDFILAVGIIDEIEGHNGIVQAHATTLEQGLFELERARPDACILNIRLGPDMVYPLADRLLELGVPFISQAANPESTFPIGSITWRFTGSQSTCS